MRVKRGNLMKNVVFYLKSVFGNNVNFLYDEWDNTADIFLNEEFEFLKIQVCGDSRRYILARPRKRININISGLKKHQNQIEKYTGCNAIFVLDELRLSQRNSLIQSNLAFVVLNYQIYIPGVMLNLTEQNVIKKEYESCFSVPAQVIFIYMLLNDIEETNAHQLASKLPFSVATINRALNELVVRELVFTTGSSTRKVYKWYGKSVFWVKGRDFLFNPVSKVYYTKSMPVDLQMSNEQALYTLSEISQYHPVPHYAASGKEIDKIADEEFVDNHNDFEDLFYVIEKFKYDPKILSNSPFIDVISLYAQFKENKDDTLCLAVNNLVSEKLNNQSDKND